MKKRLTGGMCDLWEEGGRGGRGVSVCPLSLPLSLFPFSSFSSPPPPLSFSLSFSFSLSRCLFRSARYLHPDHLEGQTTRNNFAISTCTSGSEGQIRSIVRNDVRRPYMTGSRINEKMASLPAFSHPTNYGAMANAIRVDHEKFKRLQALNSRTKTCGLTNRVFLWRFASNFPFYGSCCVSGGHRVPLVIVAKIAWASCTCVTARCRSSRVWLDVMQHHPSPQSSFPFLPFRCHCFFFAPLFSFCLPLLVVFSSSLDF